MKLSVQVAGVTFEGRQKLLRFFWIAQEEMHSILHGSLVPEPDNKFDSYAVKVLVRAESWNGSGSEIIPNTHIGYIPRNVAERLSPLLLNPEYNYGIVVKSAHIVRGSKMPYTYGVRLILEIGEELARTLAEEGNS